MKIANQDSELIAQKKDSPIRLDEGRFTRVALAAIRLLSERAGV
jgi:hypothetical protein